jgi:hypothetical protein
MTPTLPTPKELLKVLDESFKGCVKRKELKKEYGDGILPVVESLVQAGLVAEDPNQPLRVSPQGYTVLYR